ncbi:hypothetical protein ACJW31_01G064600 [Castanea mollissima]
MMKKKNKARKRDRKKQFLSGILMNNHGVECLSSALVQPAKLARYLVVNYDLLDPDHLKFCKGFHIAKKINFNGARTRKSSSKNVLKRVRKHSAAKAVILRIKQESASLSWVSYAKYCANLAVHRGKTMFERPSVDQPGGLESDMRPEFYFIESHATLIHAGAPAIVKAKSHAFRNSDSIIRDGNGGFKISNSSLNYHYKKEANLSLDSLLPMKLPESTLGWPLLKKIVPMSYKALRKSQARKMSVVQWAMNLPHRSMPLSLQNQVGLHLNKTDMSFDRKAVNYSYKERENEEGTRPQLIQASEFETVHGSKRTEENFGLVCENKMEVPSSSASVHIKESPQSKPGWPLLRIAASANVNSSRDFKARKMSVVQWLMSLPKRSISVSPQKKTSFVSNKTESPIERESSYSGDFNSENGSTASGKLLKELELLIRTNLSGYRWFSHKELNNATSHFSSENIIGEGGCSNVYKGYLPSGRTVAVKILKSYKEAGNDFYSEMDIISTLKHKHITSLIGVCVEDSYLISVYDFFPLGSLEEHLHGQSNRSVLSWEVRFKVAVAVAEALNYLHNECSRPVIHRDIKSSNILLSNEFQPQLSDFGLAVWGPTDSTHVIHSDVVGTFGYIAPEYFMRGRVSDKIDVYSFGVVLLELLSGRKPIGSETLKGQKSLVKWAKPLLESEDLKALLDPKLNGNFEVDQMHRMFLAAGLCVRQSARLRPKISQILKLLTGEKDAYNCLSSNVIDFKEIENQDDDDIFPEFYCNQQYMGSTLLKTESNSSSLSSSDISIRSAEKTRHFMLKDYLKERQD